MGKCHGRHPMIASTLQLSLNRAKVSFLLCGSNEKFINLSRIVEGVLRTMKIHRTEEHSVE